MTAQPEINMPLDEIIQKRIKEDKGKRPLLNKRRRRFLLRKKYLLMEIIYIKFIK